jgi:hypothetical protein
MHILLRSALAALAAMLPIAAQTPKPEKPVAVHEPRFVWPVDDYHRGLRGRGNFGVLITAKGSPFAGTYHLAEDIWLPGGTEVRCIADGIVRYSDFSPSWKDAGGRIHWNLGNVIVIEHALVPPVDDQTHACSVYVHLAADRRVKVGDVVRCGQVIGSIGRDRSEENGLYPAHLHFGIHRGPYMQISPAWRRNLETEAKTTGIAIGIGEPIRGEIELVPREDDSVLVRSKADGRSFVLSLLTGSTAPDDKPADIMGWCSGYGDKPTVDEWLRPSRWIADRIAATKPIAAPTDRSR